MIKLYRIFIYSTQRLFRDKYTYRISALSFETLLAIVPLIAVIMFFMTLFPFFSHLISLAQNYIMANFLPDAAIQVKQYFHNFVFQAVRLPTFSIIFLIFTGLMMINTVDETLNDIWNVTVRRKRLTAILIYWLIIILAPLLVGLSVLITTYFFSFYFFTYISFSLLFLIPVLINTFLFSLIYYFAPNTSVKISHALLGGFIASIFFELARFIFTYYVVQFSSYASIYGIFAIIPIFLMWLYIAWFIFLWGAIFTYSLTVRKA